MKYLNLLLICVVTSFAAEDFMVQSYSNGMYCRAITLHDYNGDGVADVWAGDFNGYKVEIWIYNAVKDSLEKVDEITGFPYSIFDIDVADLDGDNDMDAAVAVRNNGTYVCINNGDSWDVSNIDGTYGWQVLIDDFDLDGNPDIVAGTDWDYIKVFYGDGDGSFTLGASPQLEQSNGDCKGLNVADINNDGRPDLIGLVSEWYGGGSNQYFLRAYANLDTGNINWVSVGPRDYYSAYPAWTLSSPRSAGDLNKDGYIDLVGYSSDNRLDVYHGGVIDDSLTWDVENVAMLSGRATAAVMFDVDNDTYPDIIYGGYNNFNDLHIYYNDQAGSFVYDSVKVDFGIGDYHSLKAADVTGNGWKDIVASKYSGSNDGFVFLRNVKSSGRIYVDENAGGNNTGLSWANAYSSLSQAITNATGGAEIWVAAGTYIPDTTGLSDHRQASFTLSEGISLYGGFAGTESTLNEREWENNQTILSGDIGILDDSSDNCYHVILGNTSTRLDGFYVTGGFANGADQESLGGGILSSYTGSTDITNCIFEDNFASQG
ncbi:MAG: VCBS repeat-containing protein, partial [Calditrichaceae bacterium]